METRGQTGDASEMRTLTDCINKLKQDGFKEDFKVTNQGLSTYDEQKFYKPHEIHILNFYRFEGTSDPGDNTVLYAIVTDDGTRGTLSDGYGAYANSDVSKFITEVEDIKKRIPTSKIDA